LVRLSANSRAAAERVANFSSPLQGANTIMWNFSACSTRAEVAAAQMTKASRSTRLKNPVVSSQPGWRNWQTQRTQNPPVLGTLGVRLPLPAPAQFWFHGLSCHHERLTRMNREFLMESLRADRWYGGAAAHGHTHLAISDQGSDIHPEPDWGFAGLASRGRDE
jgi:hypothetical protein